MTGLITAPYGSVRLGCRLRAVHAASSPRRQPPPQGGRSTPLTLDLSEDAVERRYLNILKAVKAAVTIPVAVKIGPYFTAIGNMARRLDQAGADGLVLFNRFYWPDIDVAQLTVSSDLDLSQWSEMRLPLLWLGVLAGRVAASLALSTGVDGSNDVIKYLLVGADVVMTTSSLLRRRIGHIKVLRGNGLERRLAACGTDSLLSIRGSMSHQNVADTAAFERANYIKVLQGYQRQ